MTTTALYWYASIFFWLFLTGIGLPPAPEEAGILYAASVNALHPEVYWPFAWLACGLGIICADCVLYGVGYRWGPKLFEYRWVQKVMSTERRERIEGHFTQHGMKLLILARFLPPLRTGVFLIAGATRYSFIKFLVADLIYAVVGVGCFSSSAPGC
jgi:membrane protein DedA with SNARE-associated domain